MGVKVKNHTVTRAYLAGWKSVDSSQRVGLWYFDIASRAVLYAPSLNAPFAVTKAIYAPKVNGRRDDRLENWFAASETELCDFVRDYRTDSSRRWKPQAVHKALSAIVSLGYRGEYALRLIEQHLKTQMPSATTDEVTVAALDNLYNIAQDRIRYFLRGTAIVLHCETSVLMTNDQPFWDMSPRSSVNPFAVFPLSPNRLLVFMPNQLPANGDLQIIHEKGERLPSMVEFARLGAMRMARRWVVCSNEAQAISVRDYLTPEMWKEVTATDTLRFIKVERYSPLFGNQRAMGQ